jgi:hypothetical protein
VGFSGVAVGSAGAVAGSTMGASVAVVPPQAASKKLIITITNINERTVLIISFILLVFTLKSYQCRFKGMGITS